MNLKQKLYLSKTNKLHKQGLLNGLIKPFDEELYQELNKTIFLNIPVDLDIKYLKPEVRPGRCYDRSLAMFFAMAKSYLVRGSLEYFRIFGDEEDINQLLAKKREKGVNCLLAGIAEKSGLDTGIVPLVIKGMNNNTDFFKEFL